MTDAPVLEVRDLVTMIDDQAVVDGVSLRIGAGEVVALVGESGSGKSLMALSIAGLLPPAARPVSGQVMLDGEDLLHASQRRLAELRRSKLSMIFQEPMASLDPLMRIGEQVAESLVVHGIANRAEAARRAVEMLARVGIPDPEARARAYPAELSGGMCQRAMIACALISAPRLLIADEPTTALDVTIQAQILELMKTLCRDSDTAVMMITHDMGVVADIADRVCVMYGGRIVESGDLETIFAHPAHPYTRLLLSTISKLDGARKTELRTIAGSVPSLSEWPEGCRFRGRCPLESPRCREVPPTVPVGAAGAGHGVACWHHDRVEELT